MPELRSEEFLNKVVIPNIKLTAEQPDDERHMANAVLTLDACIGLLHRDSLERDASTLKNDSDYRNKLAENLHYRVLRDLAFA